MSRERRYTPGPWEIDTATRPAEICTIHGLPVQPTEDGKGQTWAYVRGAIGYWSADEAEQLANANLVAAAPELLEALESFEKVSELWLPQHADDENHGEAVALHQLREKALAAIAKAYGEDR